MDHSLILQRIKRDHLNFHSVSWQKIYEGEKANAVKAQQEQQKQRRKRQIKRFQEKLSFHKQGCRCRFGICNGK